MRLSKENYKQYKKYAEKVVQFGEGNFLRAFADWIIDCMNDNGIFNGSAAAVQPIPTGMADTLNEQDGLYTLFLQGIKDGKAEECCKVINSISRGINPYSDYDSFLKLSEGEDLRFVISNTTEAGIMFDEKDELDKSPNVSFPAKLTAFMYHRFLYFMGSHDKGFIVMPCELIDRNGEKLKEAVLKYAKLWNLGSQFAEWIENDNVFCCTLVDRIVPGYPRQSISEIQQKLGYEDKLADVGELFHLWVIEGPKWIENEFPAASIGLNVKFVNDITPYRDRKVRILNGAHTTMVPVAYLYGIDTVRDAVEDENIGRLVREAVYEEIIPTLDLEYDELDAFAGAVFERFKNPFIRHNLMSIALNSMSKYETRVLPSLLKFVEIKKRIPLRLTFSLAAYIKFYKGYRGSEKIGLSDSEDVLELYNALWSECDGSYEGLNKVVTGVLGFKKLWEMDLNTIEGLNKAVTDYLFMIEHEEFSEALKEAGLI